MKDAKVNMNRPQLSEEDIDKAKDFDQLMKMNEPPIKIKWAKIGGVIAVVAGVLAFIFWPSSNNEDQEKEAGKTVNHIANEVNNQFFLQTNLASDKYLVNGEKGDSIITENGTVIIVPPQAFLDKNGNTILEEVELSFREFHDVPSIFGSNIDMTYDSAGVEYHFESAGMIEIVGVKDGEEVLIDKENPLIVQLNSQQNGDYYNIYFMDPEGDWEFIKKDTAKQGSFEKQLGEYLSLNSLEFANKEQATLLEKKAIQAKSAYSEYQNKLKEADLFEPQEADDDLFSIKLKYSAAEFPELNGYENVLFEVTEQNKNFDKNLSKESWTDIKLSKGSDDYIMTLFGAQKIELFVRPVFAGADIEMAEQNFEELFAAYDAAHQNVLSSSKELMTAAFQKFKATEDSVINVINQTINQAAWSNELSGKSQTVKRVFEVDNFGFWNSDCPQNLPKGQNVQPVFVNVDKEQDTLTFQDLYIAEYDKNAFYTYWGNWGHKKYVDEKGKEHQTYEGPEFTFNPKSETVLWAITNKGELAVIIPEELGKVKFKKEGVTTIKMKLHKNIIDIKKIKKAIGWK